MKEEKKKPESENKIAPFDIDEDLLEDEAIDRLLKESLMKEADELEAELNENPMLREADVADSMFQSIVRQLKEQGLWEEEEADKEQEDKEPEGNRERKESKKREKSGAEEVRKQQPPNIQKVLEESAGQLPETTSGELLKKSVEKTEGAETAEALRETGKRTEIRPEESLEKPEKRMEGKAVEEGSEAAGKESGAKAEESIKKSAEKAVEAEQDETLEKSQKQLQTDAGREMQKKRRKRKKRILRHSGIVAAVLVAAFCGSMTSEANRRLVLKVWDGMMESFGLRVPTNYVEDDKTIRSEIKEELKAMEKIRNEIGVHEIDFCYLPEGMTYLNYTTMKDNLEARLFYEYQGKIFSVVMINADIEGVLYYVVDDNAVECESVYNDQNIEAKIWRTNLDKEETYIAEMIYDDYRYIFNGMLPLEELKKILKSAIIL